MSRRSRASSLASLLNRLRIGSAPAYSSGLPAYSSIGSDPPEYPPDYIEELNQFIAWHFPGRSLHEILLDEDGFVIPNEEWLRQEENRVADWIDNVDPEPMEVDALDTMVPPLTTLQLSNQLKVRKQKTIQQMMEKSGPLLLGPRIRSATGRMWHQLAYSRRIVPENGSQSRIING